MRINPKDVKPIREQMLKEQNGVCAICSEPIAEGEAVLDHCHKTGHLRGVLHRGCNAFIGHMENNQPRNRITPTRLQQILNNFLFYVSNHKELLHPTYRTEEEKRERAKKKRRKLGKRKPKA